MVSRVSGATIRESISSCAVYKIHLAWPLAVVYTEAANHSYTKFLHPVRPAVAIKTDLADILRHWISHPLQPAVVAEFHAGFINWC